MWSVIFLLVFSFFSDSIYCLFIVVFSFVYFFFTFNYGYLNMVSLTSFNFYLDYVGIYFMFLSFFLIIFIVCLGLSNGLISFYFFENLVIFLLLVLILFFSSGTKLKLYMYFELSFVVMLVFMLFWGVKPERVKAVKYLVVYTFLGSLPLFLNIITCHHLYNFIDVYSYMMKGPCNVDLVKDKYFIKSYLFLFWVLAFLMKIPVFGFHLWLPKAHVEAPVFGSMLLAGIMLKVGVFGLFRFMVVHYGYSFLLLYFLMGFFCLGLVIMKLVCSRQFDLKSFVAYSSVVHMSLISISVWFVSLHSIVGSILLSFAHGFCSSGLFLGVKSVYSLSGSRKMLLNRGYLYIYPMFIFLWFLLCSCNASMPLSLNFFSELLMISSGVNFINGIYMFFIFNVFFCGFYCIYLYLLVSHGKLIFNLKYFSEESKYMTSKLNILFHVMLIYLYFMFMDSLSCVF